MLYREPIVGERNEPDQIADYATRFLTEVLGFDADRVHRRVIERLSNSLAGGDTSVSEREAALIAAITVGETYFLRHKCHFSWIVDRWLPDRLTNRPSDDDRPLRILCAGCASGEEPYSVASVLRRATSGTDIDFRITAFDVNGQFLARAREASYRLWSLRNIDLGAHNDWLRLDGSTVRVRPPVRDDVDFVEHNLLTPMAAADIVGPFDLILCRNVLIYFHQRAIETAYRHLTDVLADDGSLLVGPTDPGPPVDSELQESWNEDIRVFQCSAEETDPESRRSTRPPGSDRVDSSGESDADDPSDPSQPFEQPKAPPRPPSPSPEPRRHPTSARSPGV